MIYPVNEFFQTIQGEGNYTGTPSIFIRLQGCPVGCSWCDTKQTWDVDPNDEVDANAIITKSADSPTWFNTTPEALLSIIQQEKFTAKHIVITGGEPCLYDLHPLTNLFIDQGYSIQIETSGTFEIKTHEKTWVTVSPKVNMKGGYPVLNSALQRANEIKHPIATENHIFELEALLQNLTMIPLVYLQPISQKKRATELAIETCIKKNWRLSIQTHKYLGIS